MLRSVASASLSFVHRRLAASCVSVLGNHPVRPRFLHSSPSVSNGTVKPSHFHPFNENFMSYEFLTRDPKYQPTLAPNSDDFHRPDETLSNDQFILLMAKNKWDVKTILDDFVKISYFVHDQQMKTPLADTCFNEMVAQLIEASNGFDYETLCKAIFCMRLWFHSPNSRSNNFCALWNHLDLMCQQKCKDWTKSQLLILCDHWHRLNVLRIGYFGKTALHRILKKSRACTTPEIVQSLFYINIRRYFHPDIDKVNLQVHLVTLVSALSLEEVGICAMAFFKTKTRIVSYSLMEMMIRKFITGAETVNFFSLTCLLKVMRMGLHIGLIPLANQLNEKLYPRVKNGEISFHACTHLSLAGTNIQKPHYGIINATTEILIRNISEIRLKDIERMCMTLQMFKIPKEFPGISDDIYKLIGEEIARPERRSEIDNYASSFTCLLHFLSVSGYFNYDLINFALGHKFLSNVYMPSVKNSGFEILSLDVSLEVECPDYVGARLSGKGRRHLAIEMSQNPCYYFDFPISVDKGARSDKILKKIAVAVTKCVGPDWKQKIYIGHAIPNFYRPDIFLKLNSETGEFEDIPVAFTSAWVGEVKRPDSSSWISVVLASRSLCIRDSEPLELTGNLNYKLRLLQKVGYNPIVVKHTLWPEIDETEQVSFMQNALDDIKNTLLSASQAQKVKV